MNLDYKIIFERNYGIFDENDQERIRRTRVLIIGDSGVGETIAIILARCGVERIVIAGEDRYEPSDMNRQMCCFSDTIGRRKVDVIRETVLSINPRVDVVAHHHLPAEGQLDPLVTEADVVIPAVDDFPYSIQLFRAARRHAKPAVLCLPSGSMGYVSVFTERGPTIEGVLGVPALDYEGMHDLIHTREYRCGQYNLITAGDWRVDWFWDYFKGARPLALICPVEWMLTSLAAMEILKIGSQKWPPMEAPRCWYARNGNVSDSRFSWFLRWHRKLGWLIFGSKTGKRLHKVGLWLWRPFFKYLKGRQERQETEE
jgi:molybdopterin/thiamine biosynthesis adenylyltransferase